MRVGERESARGKLRGAVTQQLQSRGDLVGRHCSITEKFHPPVRAHDDDGAGFWRQLPDPQTEAVGIGNDARQVVALLVRFEFRQHESAGTEQGVIEIHDGRHVVAIERQASRLELVGKGLVERFRGEPRRQFVLKPFTEDGEFPCVSADDVARLEAALLFFIGYFPERR